MTLEPAQVKALAAAARGVEGGDDTELLRDGLAAHARTRRFVRVPRGRAAFWVASAKPEPCYVRRSAVGFSNKELKAECKRNGLPVGGGRFELVLRLVEAGRGADGVDDLVALE